MISPTGYGIRGDDSWGSGSFGAPRGKRLHDGVDFICTPGQKIWFPFDTGYMVRVANPYSKPGYSGCEIHAMDNGNSYICKIFYFQPDLYFIHSGENGPIISQGQTIGIAQDISKKYPDITWHIHLQVRESGRLTDWIDPTTIWEVPQWH